MSQFLDGPEDVANAMPDPFSDIQDDTGYKAISGWVNAKSYGFTIRLSDDRLINIRTIITGAGIGAQIELEAIKPLSQEDIDFVFKLTERLYPRDFPQKSPPRLPLQNRY